jgi:hypothetical protein
MLTGWGSATETELKLEASAPKIAVAIRPRRPVEGVEVFMVLSWIVDERRLDLPDGPVGFSSTSGTLCAPERRCMKLGPRLVNEDEDW